MASNYRVLFLAFFTFFGSLRGLERGNCVCRRSAASILVPEMRRRVPCTRRVYIVARAYFKHLQSERKENV